MPGKQRFKPEQVIAALQATKGMVYLAAKRLKCDPDTILNYCKRYPAVESVKNAQRGQMVDLAEQKLLESIQRGEAWGISFCLKTIGKDRGYVERQEVSSSPDAPMVLRVVYEDAIDVTPTPPRLHEAPPRLLEPPNETSSNGSSF